MDLNLTEQATQRARNTVRCARNLGTARKEARVRTECATHAVKPAIPRANVHPKLSAYSTRAPKKRICSTTDLATKCANVARNMATARHIVRNHDAKHAAAQITKTLGSSNALSTRVRNAKARWIQKGTNKNNCPQILSTICTLCEEVGHDEERCPTRPCPACGNRTHRLPTHFECPEHICATCGEKGHNRTNCPTSQCETCVLFGHLANDCPFVNCVDVPIDWLNILMSTKSTESVIAFFEDVSLASTSLRIDGLIKPFTDWDDLQRSCILVTNQQLLEVKRASLHPRSKQGRMVRQVLRR